MARVQHVPGPIRWVTDSSTATVGPRDEPALVSPAAATTAAEAAPASSSAVLARLGLVDGEVAALDLLAVQGGDCGLGLLVAAHLHKPKPLGPAGVPVHDDLRRLHGPVRREHLFERGVRDPV